jgi:hypothetical protein
VEVTGGVNGEGAMYGARVGQQAFQKLSWSLGYDGNARATDSLALQALDGREDRISASISGPVNDNLILSANAYYSWTTVGGDKLGEAYGFELGADYILQMETLARPELAVSYFGEYRKFQHASTVPSIAQQEVRRAELVNREVAARTNNLISGDPTKDVLNTLADPETNRHGALFRIGKHFGDSWDTYAQGGVFYAFDDESLEFLGAIGAEYWITPTSMFFTELRYTTTGKGASTGGGVFEANLGAMVSF